MDFNFLTEAPSKEDRFNSKSHQLVADSIVNVFENKPDVHIVGLEGNLGSGKSTVIELIKDKPECKSYKFFVFDVEQHHCSSTKKAFISLFSDWILGFCGKEKVGIVVAATDKSLGNVLEYEKKNRSNISWWTIGFMISLLFSASSMKPLFGHLDLYFTENNYEFFCAELFIWGSLFLLPGFILLILWGISKISGNKDKDSKIPTVGDLFKRNTIDTITEKLEVTREVGSIELRDSMQVFVNSIPDDVKCVLVIDNLDRVSAEKVKEIWSDLEVFISVANASLKIILPFSSRHIADALSDDDDGYEFIAKRIPVSFRVPPIVSVGWQETFDKFWRDATSQADSKTIKVCGDILNLLLPKSFNGHVTPRLMKRYINDIFSLKMTTPVDIHPAVSAFYIAAISYSDEKPTVESLIQIPPVSDVIGSIHKKLSLIANNDIEWPVQIMCLHYQTKPEIAKSELLNQPLDRAIKQHDADAIIEREDIYGFKEACEKVISNNSYVDIIKLADSLLESDHEFAKSWVSVHISIINHELADQLSQLENQKHDSDLVNALLSLIDSNLPIDIKPINALYNKNLAEVKLEIKDGESKDFVFEGLSSLYLYSKLINIIPELISNPKGDFYINELWKEKEKWTYWNIENINLTKEQVGNAILKLFEAPSTTPSNDQVINILNRVKLGWFDFTKGINEQPPTNLTDFTTFTQNTDIKNIQILVFDHRWHTQDSITHYINNINRITKPAIKEELLSQALIHIIQLKTYQHIPQWKGLADQHPGYKKYISKYLPFVSTFAVLMDVLDRPEINGFLNEPIKSLISNGKVHRLIIEDVLTAHYSKLKSAVSDATQLLEWAEGWSRHLKPDDISLDELDDEFVTDVLLLSDQFDDYKDILYSKIDSTSLDKSAWINLLSSKHKNTTSIIEHMKEHSYHLSHSDGFTGAIEELFTTNTHSSSIGSFNDPALFNALIDIIKSDQRSHVLQKLPKAFLTVSLSDSVKERLIINLGEHVSLPAATQKADQEIIKNLLGSITITKEIATWFDKQSFFFSHWSKEDLQYVANIVHNNSDFFDNLLTDKDLVRLIDTSSKDVKEDGDS